MQSNEQVNYGRYEGASGDTQQSSYELPRQQAHAPYDDNMVEAIVQRMVQLTGSTQGKLLSKRSSRAHAGMRLALAIVSIAVLIPLTPITLIAVGGFGGFMMLGGICFFMLLINIIFNAPFE